MRLAFVTTNQDKAREVVSILGSEGIELEVVNLKLIEPQSDSLEEISIACCKEAYGKLKRPVFVEDSGLFIECLNGFPGPYSSYVYKTIGLKGVLKLLEGVVDRRAVFQSCVACKLSDGPPKVFKGTCDGRMATVPRGSSGFGFDPIFIPDHDGGRVFAEMSIEEKNVYSHRGMAVRALARWLKEVLSGCQPASL